MVNLFELVKETFPLTVTLVASAGLAIAAVNKLVQAPLLGSLEP